MANAKTVSRILTAYQSLSMALSSDKGDRHGFIVAHVATIVALALCKAPPAGLGNPADHAKLAEMFTAVGKDAYAKHCAALKPAMREVGMRSIESWDDAYSMGETIACAAFGALAPRRYTADELAARDAKKAAKKAEKADKGAQPDAPLLTGAVVADLIKAGQFSGADLDLIAAALSAVRQAVTTGALAIAG